MTPRTEILPKKKLIGKRIPMSFPNNKIFELWRSFMPRLWSHDGIICTGESYKSIVKLTFTNGASLTDPAKLFNSSLDGNTRRAIDIHQREAVDAGAFKTLIRAAVALNTSAEKTRPGRAK